MAERFAVNGEMMRGVGPGGRSGTLETAVEIIQHKVKVKLDMQHKQGIS